MKRSIILAIAATLVAAPGANAAPPVEDVTAISIVSAPGSALVVIDLSGAVRVEDFLLQNPSRLVIDVVGASLRAPSVLYDGENRGGIIDVRYSQFRSDVVRIVLEMEAFKEYQLEYRDNAIRIQLATDGRFNAWSSGERLASEPPRQTTVIPVSAQEVFQSQQPRITVSWDSARIQDVIAGFAAFSGRTIIPRHDLDLTIWAEIIDQPWDIALQEVLEVNGLRAVENPSGVIVVTDASYEAARDSLEPKETVVVPLNNKPAGSIAVALNSIIQSRGGTVIADTSTNQLIITDARNRIQSDIDLVRQLDIQSAQVSIQAKLVFVDRTEIEELGVQYDLGNQDQFFNSLVQRPDPSSVEAIDTDGDGVPDAVVATELFPQNVNVIDLGGNSLAAVGNAQALFTNNPALELIFSTAIGNFNLTAFVSALQRVELADLQAEPLITTVENTTASILVGERTPIRVIDAGAQQAQQGQQPVATIQFEETGIELEVTPHVTNAGQVLMRIHAENSSIREAPVDAGFTFQTQEADNQILVNDRETAVIGGLTVTQVTATKSGIPFLVDLPIIGKAFGFSTRREQRRDLLILVTPTITSNPAAVQND
jgi:type IV pilus assembly protein PilQ